MSDTTPRIEKLNGQNYQAWKFQVTLLLVEKGLKGFVDGTVTPPDASDFTGIDAGAQYRKAQESFEERKGRAWALICLNVETDLMVYLEGTTTAQEAWDVLANTFEARSVTQLVRLSRRFYASALPEGGNVIEHITAMTMLRKQLKEQGEEISSQKFAVTLLGSLPDSYDTSH
jgi:hypothetical protein